MNRFNYDEEDDDQEDFYSDVNDDNDESEEEYSDFVDMVELNLVRQETDQKLLFETIKFLEKSFFWKFKSNDTKLKIIIDTYLKFKSLVDNKD